MKEKDIKSNIIEVNLLKDPAGKTVMLFVNGPFQSCARDLGIARLAMHHGTVLGNANKKPVPKTVT